MKPTPKSRPEPTLRPVGATRRRAPLLAFGAHPDDIEFGCGGVIAKETRAGRAAHFVICSRGEAASHGTPAQRVAEAKKSAALARRNGSNSSNWTATRTSKFASRTPSNWRASSGACGRASCSRRAWWKTSIPTIRGWDNSCAMPAGWPVTAASRNCAASPPHAIEQLFYYAVTPEAEPGDITPVLIDVSAPDILKAWTAAMEAHASQISARNYVELQLTRARLRGLRAGVGHAIALFPNDPLVLDSLAHVGRGARRF